LVRIDRAHLPSSFKVAQEQQQHPSRRQSYT
jgi:hypothetical protein